MRLLKIGRDASCDIVLHSDKVTSLHAELTLLNNGDITIEDKGSRNGTFIMNQPIKAGKPVKVRRGDAIRFGDVELQWSQIPLPEDNSAYQGIYGIGSHFNNDIQISGATASRYHATVKHGRDGKMYIFDHSKNGTTVDGQRITSNTPHRIKKSSIVVCGGIPVDLSRLPWPTNVWKYIGGIAASIVLLVGIGFGTYKLINAPSEWTTSEINDRYSSSTVMLIGLYHYEVTAGDLNPEALKFLGIPTEIIYDAAKNEIYAKEEVERAGRLNEYLYAGTGFYVSDDAKIITNLHIVKPWVANDVLEKIESLCKRILAQKAEERTGFFAKYGIKPDGLSAYISQVKVKGVSDGVLLVPQGRIFSMENATKCTILSAGEDINKDVALIQSDVMEIPKRASYVNVKDSMDVSDEALEVGAAMFTIGFPHSTSLQEIERGSGIQAFCHTGHISQKSGEFSFRFDAVAANGSSGSPIFNDKGMLIGVLSRGVINKDITEGIKAKYVKELLENPYKK